ncbi:hypothetical protein [Planktotalea arctica]|uniref:hypothetical protein n=1 Tax=Planktotalea arctica TaxID=1481893 RepID=UPI003219269E
MGYPILQQKTGFMLLPERDRQKGASYVTLVDKNGLIQVVAQRKKRKISLVPLKFLALLVVLLTVFKALAVMNVGLVDYEEELALLQSGNIFEQASAFALQIDPVTKAIYSSAGPLLR